MKFGKIKQSHYYQFVFYRGKYGMRERLVNEEDYYSTNDVRYFGVSINIINIITSNLFIN